jgi:HlyD family secretion protein
MSAPFRKSALRETEIPEEKLDQLIKVTGTKAWINYNYSSDFLQRYCGRFVRFTVKNKIRCSGVVLEWRYVHEVVATAQRTVVELSGHRQ